MSSLSIPNLWLPPRPRTRLPWPLAHLINLATRGGNLTRTTASPYHLTTGCGGGPAPCGCLWPVGLSSTYTVSGFGSLSGCPTCDPDSIDPQWGGGLYHTGSACVWWAIDPSFTSYQINGVLLDIAYTQVVLNTALCRWELYIACTSSLHPTQTMWWGYKTTGSTPAGTYTFGGSDCGNSAGTMTVV